MFFPLADLDEALAERGLLRLGGFHLDAGEELMEGAGARGGTVLLIGNEGRGLWEKAGAEIEGLQADGVANPLDLWTQTTLDPIAERFGALAVYPFGGPPHAPFTRWALRSTNLHQSPLGLTIHPIFGLWHAFRAAFHLKDEIRLDHASVESPCAACADKPCLTACPVGAFSRQEGYNVAACRAYLDDRDVACWTQACLARVACPVGADWRYDTPQTLFHMRAFNP